MIHVIPLSGTSCTFALSITMNTMVELAKTTLTFNIAASLAKLGHNVLLVDADPQCNLSAYLIEAVVLDDLLDKSDDTVIRPTRLRGLARLPTTATLTIQARCSCAFRPGTAVPGE
jgi:hypothetical protein